MTKPQSLLEHGTESRESPRSRPAPARCSPRCQVRSRRADAGDRAPITSAPPAALVQKAGYNFLEDVTCVDCYPVEPRFQVIYHILSHSLKERVRLAVPVDSIDLDIDSIVPVWPSANFYEREVFDLFGIRFAGHPNLRRIMMPDEWEGHPLRKDYPVEGYR